MLFLGDSVIKKMCNMKISTSQLLHQNLENQWKYKIFRKNISNLIELSSTDELLRFHKNEVAQVTWLLL